MLGRRVRRIAYLAQPTGCRRNIDKVPLAAFKHAAHRQRFVEAPEQLMQEFSLSEEQMKLVRQRDWTGLVANGGHHFNIIKIAAAVGESHLHVGAHMCGADWDEFKQSLPHVVDLLPEELD